MIGLIDSHSHFLYGVDDGAGSNAEMETMLDTYCAQGVSDVIATPHMMPGLQPFQSEVIEQRLLEARQYCKSRNYNIRLHCGAEVLFSPVLEQYMENHRLPTLANSGQILLEFLPNVSFEAMEKAVCLLENNGYRIILAHIERYRCLTQRKNAYRLKDKHQVMYQVNSSAILDDIWMLRGYMIKKWLREDMIDLIASDAHNMTSRPIRLKEAYLKIDRLYGKEKADRILMARVSV